MSSAENNKNSGSIIVVEDDRIISSLLQRLLTGRGYGVRLAADGRAAAQMFDEADIAPPRLVLLDVMLPFVNGFELLEQIRRKPEWQSVPVIMLTSKTRERDVARALAAGADDYIAKPFQPDALLNCVRRFVK